MNLERLFGIVYYLLSKKRTTTSDLAEHFDVSIRTINRDINRLSQIDIPIYTTVGRSGGVYLLDNYILNNVLLSEEEQAHLLLALKGIREIDPQTSDKSFLKLQSLFRNDFDDWLEIDFSPWYEENNNFKFELIKESILNKRQIEFIYMGRDEPNKKRLCNPYKLIYKSHSWYVYAFCTGKKTFRYFKVNRMNSIYNTRRSFSPMIPPNPPTKFPQKEKISVSLEFSGKLLYRVFDEFNHEDIISKKEGSILVETSLPNDDSLIRYLLSFGKHLKVLSPNIIRNKMKEELMAIFECY